MDAPADLHATISLTYLERLRANTLLMVQSPVALAWSSVFPLLGVFVAYLMVTSRSSPTWLSVLAILACFSWLPIVMLAGAFSAYRAARREGPATFQVDATGLRIRVAIAELKLEWSAIRRVREAAGFVMFYFGPRSAHCLPVRSLRPGDADAILALAAAGGVPRVGR